MSTGNKPMTPQERIKADAEAYANNEYSAYASNINDIAHSVWKSCVTTYIAGATAEHGRAQVLVDALENAKKHIHELCMTIIRLGYTPFNPISEINEALEQWKGKEPDRPCPHCGKELSRDRNICCRECGKEVGDDA